MTSSTITMKDIKSKLYWPAMITISAFLLLLLVFAANSESNKKAYNEESNFSVSNSTAISFSYNTTTTTFTYQLLLFVTVPDSHMSPDYVNATASYLNHRFASEPDETLVRGFTGIRMRFNGNDVVPFTEDQILTLQKDHMAGLYNITLTIWPWQTDKFKVKIGLLKTLVLCHLQLPLQSRVFCGWTNHH